MDFKEKLEGARRARDLAAAQISDKDREDAKILAEFSKLRDEELALKEQARDLAASRYEIEALDELGYEAPIRVVLPTAYPDVFVVQRKGNAHDRWVKAVASSKGDTIKANLDYVMQCVYSWNGEKDLEGLKGPELRQYLTVNPGIVTALVNELSELAGIFARERKSVA